ncbi:MAG TPA: amino acid ABC transporter substrate-binding protein [Anaerolineae bacterium]
MANFRRALFLLGLVSSLALVVTSCSGAPAPSTTVPSNPAPAATTAGSAGGFDGTIVFGAAVSLTGSTSNEGKYTKDGYETAKDALNAAGGIQVAGKRYKIDIKYYDDASKADQTSQLVEKLITEDKVTFLLGPYGSAPTNTAAAIVEKYKMPMVEANGAAESIFNRGFKYTFGILSPGKMYLRGILDLVKAKDPSAKQVAVIAETDPFAIEVADGTAAYAKEQGFNVVYNEKYPTAAKDVSPQLTAIKGLNPDIVLGAGHIQDAILTVKQAKDIGVNAKAWGFSVGPTSPEFRNSLKKDADYVFGGAQWTEDLKLSGDDVFATPQGFAKQVRAKFAGAYDATVPYQVAESAAAVITYQKAIQAAGSLDPDKVRDALAKLNFDSFFGHIQFDDRGINVYKSMAVMQNQTDGSIYTVGPANVAQKTFQYPAPLWDKR